MLAKVDRSANRLYVLELNIARPVCFSMQGTSVVLARTIRASELPWALATGGRRTGGRIATN
jgi:hypothetical protein